MVDEIKNINSVNAAQSGGAEYSAGKTDLKKILIFEEFKKYAEAHGIELTTENLQAIEASMQEEVSALSLLDILKEILGFKKTEPTSDPAEVVTTEGAPVDEDMQNFFMAASSVLTEDPQQVEEPVTAEVAPATTAGVTEEPTAEEVETAVADEVAQEPETVEQEAVAETDTEVVEPEQQEVTEPVAEEVEPAQMVQMESLPELEPAELSTIEVEPGVPQEVEVPSETTQETDDELDFGIDTQTTDEFDDFRVYISIADLENKTQDEMYMIMVKTIERQEYIAADPGFDETEMSQRAIDWDNDHKDWDIKWAELSDEERSEKIAKCNIDISKSYDYNVMLINAATDQCSTYSEYIKNTTDEAMRHADGMAALAKMDENGVALTDNQRYWLEQENLKIEVVTQTLAANGYPEVANRGGEIDYYNVDSIINGTNDKYKVEFDYESAFKSYVENSENKDKLNEIFSGDKEKIANLKDYVKDSTSVGNTNNAEKQETAKKPFVYGSRSGEKTALDKEYEEKLKKENPAEYEKYRKAPPKVQLEMRIADLKMRHENGELSQADIDRYIRDCGETGNKDEEAALYALIGTDEKLREGTANSQDEAVKDRNMDHTRDLKEHASRAVENAVGSAETKEKADDRAKRGQANASDNNSTDVFEVLKRFRARGKISAKASQYAIDNQQRRKLSIEDHNRTKDMINELPEEDIVFSVHNSLQLKDRPDVQRIYFNGGVEGHPGVAEQAIPWIKELCTENQESGFLTTHQTIENSGLADSDKIRLGRMLGDQVELLDASAQLGAHNSLINSHFGEVATYAAGNISHYDQSVQAAAYNSSYQVAANTNNNDMMNALNGQYSQLSPQAQQAIASNPQYAASMSASAAGAMSSDTMLHGDISNESGAGFEKSKKELLLEKWEKLTPAQKYNIICDMSVRNFSKMSPSIRKRILEHAKNDPLFMHRLVEKFGMDLLKNELFPDALSVIVRDLLRDPSQRRAVAQEVFNNPSRYSAQLVEDCQDILLDYADNIDPEVFNSLSRYGKIDALKNPDDYRIPDDIADESMAYVPEQSGSNHTSRPDFNDKWSYLKNKSSFYRLS